MPTVSALLVSVDDRFDRQSINSWIRTGLTAAHTQTHGGGACPPSHPPRHDTQQASKQRAPRQQRGAATWRCTPEIIDGSARDPRPSRSPPLHTAAGASHETLVLGGQQFELYSVPFVDIYSDSDVNTRLALQLTMCFE